MKAVLERFEKAGSSEKLERPESWSGVNARTMESWKNGKLEALESWNDRKAGKVK
jgi:hypothetical protein